jgi:uncharacterized cupredoxin-like copper-binding protein
MKNNKGLAALVLLVLASVLLAACSGGGGGSSAANLTVTIKESGCASGMTYCFDPATLTVNSGQDVTISVKNTGANQHTFVFKNLPGTTKLDLAAGKDGTVTFKAPAAAGDYVFYCDVPGHEQLGMTGVLTVK